MAVKKISKVQPEKFEFNKKNKETADSIIKIILLVNNKVRLWPYCT